MVAQSKGRAGTDYMAQVLAQPCLKLQLDK